MLCDQLLATPLLMNLKNGHTSNIFLNLQLLNRCSDQKYDPPKSEVSDTK